MQVSEQLVPSKPATARSAGVAAAAVSAEQGTKAGSSSSGWAVLQQDGIVGALGTGTRLKVLFAKLRHTRCSFESPPP